MTVQQILDKTSNDIVTDSNAAIAIITNYHTLNSGKFLGCPSHIFRFTLVRANYIKFLLE